MPAPERGEVDLPELILARLGPTIGAAQSRSGDQNGGVEVHLLDYAGPDFYTQTLEMVFLYRIRDERRFPGVDALVAQIQSDCRSVQQRVRVTP